MFTEEYQVDTVRRYFPIFDKFRGNGLVGEMIWNLADFMTAQGILFKGLYYGIPVCLILYAIKSEVYEYEFSEINLI